MGILPVERLTPFTRPFSYVGIDYFGPFHVTVARHSEKRYGVIFTCLTCRAVHLEISYSLSTSSCVMAFRNFISRRGTPIHVFSDNGTNLHATEKELKEAHKRVDFESVKATFNTLETNWTFIPPASPHMGGAWERMVRSIKKTLYSIVTPNTKLTDEKLHNLMTEVESIINNRPLTYLPLNTADEEALTPNHFLLGSSSGHKPMAKFNDEDEYVRNCWRQVQLLADRFWKQWVDEYLRTTRRTKWFEKTKANVTNEIVIVVDSLLPRHCWPKGVVIDVVKARDGQVRSAYVRTKQGTYHRPAAKLAVLEIRTKKNCGFQS